MGTLFGLIVTGASFYGFFWVGKRRFGRTNRHGVQEHESYGSFVRSGLVEGLVVLGCVFGLFIGLALTFLSNK